MGLMVLTVFLYIYYQWIGCLNTLISLFDYDGLFCLHPSPICRIECHSTNEEDNYFSQYTMNIINDIDFKEFIKYLGRCG